MSQPEPFELCSQRIGALPIVCRFLARMGLGELLGRYLPMTDRRSELGPAAAIGVIVRNLCLAREPLYGLGDWAAGFEPSLLGLGSGEAELLNDDRAGRALDALFAADRGSLLLELVLGVIGEFGIDTRQLHNDSTSITVYGAYRNADGRPSAGRPTPRISFGHSKDHRPDLKQLVWILTVTADGAVPLAHRLCDGNTADQSTHIETWEGLVRLVGSVDFLYVADSKLATREQLGHIADRGGRFVCVLPKSRGEYRRLCEWLQGPEPDWTEAARRPAARAGEPDEVWSVAPAPFGSDEGYRIVCVHSTQKQQLDEQARADCIARALRRLDDLSQRLAGPKCRFRDRDQVERAAQAALAPTHAAQLVRFTVTERVEERTREESRGAGRKPARRRISRKRFGLSWEVDEHEVAAEATRDGFFPLISNASKRSAAELLSAYRYQPNLEKRHHQLKRVQEAAPVLLKSPARIEALFTCHFLALLCTCLIERELRQAMAREGIEQLSLYPEKRECSSPTATRLFAHFADISRHHLLQDSELVQVFNPKLSALQQQLLELLDVPVSAYAGPGSP